MVWLHGGGFTNGSSIEQVAYDGENLSRKGDVVVVSLNHRLNILGYLDLSAYGDKYKYSENVGMADIVAALEWIKTNINNVQLKADQNGAPVYTYVFTYESPVMDGVGMAWHCAEIPYIFNNVDIVPTAPAAEKLHIRLRTK